MQINKVTRGVHENSARIWLPCGIHNEFKSSIINKRKRSLLRPTIHTVPDRNLLKRNDMLPFKSNNKLFEK